MYIYICVCVYIVIRYQLLEYDIFENLLKPTNLLIIHTRSFISQTMLLWFLQMQEDYDGEISYILGLCNKKIRVFPKGMNKLFRVPLYPQIEIMLVVVWE